MSENKIYSFLAGFGSNEKWRLKADEMIDKDGVITINEFRALIDSDEWDTNTLGDRPDNDIINKFFRKFDDNKSGAVEDRIRTTNGNTISNLYAWSKDEAVDADLEANVEKFVEINKLIKENNSEIEKLRNEFGAYQNTNACSEFIKTVKNNIIELLAKKDLKEINQEAFDTILGGEDIKNLKNEYLTEAVIETLGKNYKHLVEHGYNITEDSDLRNAIAEVVAGENCSTGSINKLIADYLTGNLNEPLTNGQKDFAAASKRKMFLENMPSEYNDYKEAYIAAVDEFLNNKKESANIMNDISTLTINDLLNDSNFVQNLQNKIKLQKKADDHMAKFDGYINDCINRINNKAITDLINDDLKNELRELLKNSILNGEFTGGEADAVKWLTEQINTRLEKLFTNGYSNIPDENVQAVHNYRMGVIQNANYSEIAKEKGCSEADIRLEYAQNAAIDYCTWLAGKSDEHEKVVLEKLGISTIANIENAFRQIQNVTNKLTEIIDACNNIIIQPEKADETNDTAQKALEEADIDKNKIKFKDKYLAELLNGTSGGHILCDFDYTSLEDTIATAIMNFKTFAKELGEAFKKELKGHETAVDNAVNTVIELYTKAIKEIYDPTSRNDKEESNSIQMKHSISYLDRDGNVQVLNSTFGYFAGRNKDDIDMENGIGMLSESSTLGLRLEETTNGWSDNSYSIGININKFVNVFMAILLGQKVS